jgi:hypothetical protein
MEHINKTTFIYGLADPTTHEVRYIGKSNHPNKRYKDHLADTKNSYKRNWLSSLSKLNLTPELIILEEVLMSEWQEKERHYISLHLGKDAKLVNGTLGGDGVQLFGERNGFYNKTHSDETKLKLSLAGKQRVAEANTFFNKKHTEESVNKMKDRHALRGDQWKEKQRESHLGRKDPSSAYENKSIAQSGEKNGNAKVWTLKSPEGIIIQIRSLKTWCKQNSITVSKIHSSTKRQASNDWIILNQ